MSGTKEEQNEALSINPPNPSSNLATLVDLNTLASPQDSSTELEQNDIEEDPFKDPGPAVPEITLSPILPALGELPIRKRVVFAETLSAPTPILDDETTSSVSRSGSINEDFDFSARQNTSKTTRFTGFQRKLDKKKSAIIHRRSLSSFNMPQPPAEHHESTPSTSRKSGRRISQSLDAIFGPPSPRHPSLRVPSPSAGPAAYPVTDSARTPDVSSFSATTTNPLPATPFSSLPRDRAALEALINIHLSKLDRYKRQVNDFNSVMSFLYNDLYKLVSTPEAQAVPQLVTALQMEIEETRAGRDSKWKYVDFHRGELKMIVEKRRALDEELGILGVAPGAWEGLDREEVWERRFC